MHKLISSSSTYLSLFDAEDEEDRDTDLDLDLDEERDLEVLRDLEPLTTTLSYIFAFRISKINSIDITMR